MKKLFSYAAGMLIAASVAATPTSKIVNSFNSTFPNAKNVKWFDDKEGYYVSFTSNGDFEKVLYNKKGNFVCSWKYTDGKTLPTPVVMALNKKYKDCEVKGVTECATDNDIMYEIKLGNSEAWYSVDATADGRLSNEQKYSN